MHSGLREVRQPHALLRESGNHYKYMEEFFSKNG